MSKIPYGVPTKHVKASHGGDSDIMKFYCTTNKTTYGQKRENFQPRTTRHTGTGYLANLRPGVYYSTRLDELDNPAMGRIVSDNYRSVTQLSFQPHSSATGKEPLPNSLKQAGSGFIRQEPLTIPIDRKVRDVAIDTRVASAPADFLPRYKPHLHKIQAKDPVELENGGYGPAFMTTEMGAHYQGAQPNRGDLSRKDVGPNENSGFTSGQNIEPITFYPDKAHRGDVPSYLTNRPVGVSIMKTHYRPCEFNNGKEPLPKVANRSDRESGFTNATKAQPEFLNRVMGDAYDKAGDMPQGKLDRTKKNDPNEYLNMLHPNNYSSVTHDSYKGLQRPIESEPQRLGLASTGFKEPTGFTENNDRFVQTADNPSRFITHYDTKFQDKVAKGLDREGHTYGGVQPQLPDGYTKSTAVHDFAPDFNSTATLRNLAPYVGRSLKARDPFFDDHTHDSKQYSSAILA